MKNKFLFGTIIIFNLFILYFALDINIFKASIFIFINIIFIYFIKLIRDYFSVKYYTKNDNMDLAIDTIKEEQEHFIFSTLNTLNYFCRKDVMVSRSLVLALSNYLRLVFDKSDSVRGDELLKALKSYAYVQSIRLDKNIEFKYNDTLENYRLKKNPIQNIVESLLSFIRKNGIEKSLIDLDCLENKNNLEIYIKVIVPKNYKEEIENSNIFNRYIITNEENLVYKIDMRKCSVEE